MAWRAVPAFGLALILAVTVGGSPGSVSPVLARGMVARAVQSPLPTTPPTQSVTQSGPEVVAVPPATQVPAATPFPTPKPTPRPQPAVALACGAGAAHLIDVDLSTQELVAEAGGQVVLSTPITSGMPGLRTPTGCFSIYRKLTNTVFTSPWPPGSQYYYSPMPVAYAMEFLGGGFFLHTDPNEPDSAFGPGSENGPDASHGCVHVPLDVMTQLFPWTPYGTVVHIHY
jgi:lipoprotein-anchoring transpeptidase ErfK/SrfK